MNTDACKRAYDALHGVKQWNSFRLGWEAAIRHLYAEALDEARSLAQPVRVSKTRRRCAKGPKP